MLLPWNDGILEYWNIEVCFTIHDDSNTQYEGPDKA